MMFREMRRAKQLMSAEENAAVLTRGTAGVLAVFGDGGYPYAVPLSYVYDDSKIIFHCATTGHKLDAIAQNPKVSFCVIDEDTVVPETYTTHFRSVVVFGKARILEGDDKRKAFEILAAKYSPNHEEGRLRAIDKQIDNTCLVEIMIEHMTGKEAIEFVRAKRV